MIRSKIRISLVIFDGDDTLWQGLDGGYISGVDYRDPGSSDYSFHNLDELHIQRNDGQRFRLFPEVPSVLAELVRFNVLISLASYNHHNPVIAALKAFQIEHFFAHPVVEWSSQKDKMVRAIMRQFRADHYLVSPSTTLFIDDDHHNRYRKQMESIGVHFMQKGSDILDLNELLSPDCCDLIPAPKSLV